MALDPRIGLVGRDETIALIESLVRPRPTRPSPIIVAYGPGGSGKSALLDHLERRYRELPVSRVNLDGMGSTECRDVLAAIFDDLRDYRHREFGRIRMPRYALARLAMASAHEAAREETDRHTLARNLLTVRLTKLPQAARAFAGASDVLPAWTSVPFAAMLRPFISWLLSYVVATPGARLLLLGPKLTRALRWYETVAARKEYLSLTEGSRVPAAVVRMWTLLNSLELDQQRQIDRLLVAAFLADIAAAFRPRRRRKVSCLVLLDGADLLAPFEYSLFEPNPADSPAPTSNFLELLGEARLAARDVPLLVVATQQARLDDPAEDTTPAGGGPVAGSVDPVEAARQRLRDWRARLRRATESGSGGRTNAAWYLPIRLAPFSLAHTTQFVAEWSRTQDYPVSSRALIEEVHQITRGHPLAVRLAIQAIGMRYRADMVRPAVRDAYAQRLPREQSTADPDVTIGDYLLFRFLQRFRVGDDSKERQRTRELLTVLAAPRRLDVGTIRVLAPGRDAHDVFERLSKYSFTDVVRQGDQEFLVLHPLLRDLLVKRLLARTGPPYSFRSVHQQLRDRYRSLGNRQDELYHQLALGDTDAVARELRGRIRDGSRDWPAMLDAIAEAPAPDDDARFAGSPGAAELVGREVRRIRDSTIHTMQPEIAAISALVGAIWRLRSATSTVAHLSRTYSQIADAYVDVRERLKVPSDPVINEQETRYRRLAFAAQDYADETANQALPDFCSWDQKVRYPRPLLNRRIRTGIALVTATAILAGYGYVVYANHTYCGVGGWFDVPSQAGTWWSPTLHLRQSAGECVGVTDSATSFTYGGAADFTDPTEIKDADEITRLGELIYQQNQRVVNDGRPYVTVVVATMLSTVNAQPYRDLTVGVNELRGAYLAQALWNQLDTPNRQPRFLVRVVLANLGGNSRYAETTAQRIEQLARQDPTVVAVTGMGQTRPETLTAASMLGSSSGSWTGMAMVTSSPTGNDFTSLNDVFMTGPTDDRQAQAGARYIATNLQRPGQQYFIVYDSSDSYSADLDRSYANAVTDNKLPSATPAPYLAGSGNAANQLRTVAQQVCDAPRPLVIYGGRSNEFPTFLGDLAHDGDCAARTILLGDDDFTQTETENYLDLATIDPANIVNHVFYTSSGASCPNVTDLVSCQRWLNGKAGTGQSASPDFNASEFTQLYRDEQRRNNRVAFQTGWNGEILVAFDSVGLVLDAADHATGMPNRQRVLDQLHAMTRAPTLPDTPYQGLSGAIDYVAGNDGQLDNDKQVVIQKISSNGPTLAPTPVATDTRPDPTH